jgi:hypothetical protein
VPQRIYQRDGVANVARIFERLVRVNHRSLGVAEPP